METQVEHCIDVCNKLLRGERSAVETYDRALEKYSDRIDLVPELQRIRDDHYRAARELEENIVEMGGTPDPGSGAWGSFANVVQSTANLFGPNSALEALESGEKTGRKDYRDALGDEQVMTECKQMIRADLLPRVEEHISTIDRLQHAA